MAKGKTSLIPNVVKIGIYSYSIEEIPGPIVINENVVAEAYIDHENLQIKLLDSLVPQRKIQRLMHEVEHGIERHYAIDFHNDSKEDIVDWLAVGHIQVVLDNPDLVKLITEG